MRLLACITNIFVFILVQHSVLSQTYITNGSASSLGNGCYNVTPALNQQTGTIWYSEQINLNEPFDLQFYMNFGMNDDQGADGMVFVFQQQGPNSIIFGEGSGMGYQGFSPSFGIEFDTYSNNSNPNTGQNMNDPEFDHVAFLKNGVVNHLSPTNLAGPVQASVNSPNIEDNQDHIIRLVWDPSTFTVTLFFDCEQRLTRVINLVGEIFTSAPFVYFGFTGKTGGLNNQQKVCLSTDIIPSDETVTICEGGSVQLSAGGDSNYTFNWSPNVAISDVNSQTPTVNPTETTIYTLEYTDLCGNIFTRQFEVIVEPTPSVFAGLDFTFCEGETPTLNGIVDANTTISWNTTDGNIVSGINTENPIIDTPGTYIITAESAAGCSSNDEVVVTETVVTPINLNPNYNVCAGEEVTLNVGNGYDLIQWSNLAGPGAPEQSFGEGNHSVTVTTGDCSVSFDFSVNTVVLPEIDLGPDVEACDANLIILQASTPVDWSTGEFGQEIQVTESGTYTASITILGCQTSDEINVNLSPSPVIVVPESVELCLGQSVTITSNLSGNWSTGVTGNSITVFQPGNYSIEVTQNDCTSFGVTEVTSKDIPIVNLGEDIEGCLNQDITIGSTTFDIFDVLWNDGVTSATRRITDSGNYSIEVTNECGTGADTVNIELVECDYFIFIPNTFTPDGDGTNDVWRAETVNIITYELSVFDRWGNTVFTSIDPTEYWTGEVNGGEYYAMNGVYHYVIQFTATNVDAQTMTGHLLLMR